ncbi:MAG: hypothetical protein DRR06_17405 [Gammaproteobacteria bacterium]|nr:MAG: hypothetical protein DRR06_17405 [Gammaproteobacteria bacterium]
MDKAEWHSTYRELLVSMAGMSKQQAFDYNNQNKHFVDYGYSPAWYVREEMSNLDNYSIFKVTHTFNGKVVRGV